MAEVIGFLSSLWLILVELGPGAGGPTEFLESRLMVLLLIKSTVLENFLVLINEGGAHLLQLLWIAKSTVQHPLVVSNEGHLPGEAFIPVIL